MDADRITGVEDLAAYIEEHAASIYVREEVDGKYGSFALTELPVTLAMRHAMRFLCERVIPFRVLAASERDVKGPEGGIGGRLRD